MYLNRYIYVYIYILFLYTYTYLHYNHPMLAGKITLLGILSALEGFQTDASMCHLFL